jgi:hypothetical protein
MSKLQSKGAPYQHADMPIRRRAEAQQVKSGGDLLEKNERRGSRRLRDCPGEIQSAFKLTLRTR